ncbi:MAG: 30S ribosomal protein S21 [Bacteroides thetaiotaomicron]
MPGKEGENIERALKKFKRVNTSARASWKELRRRQYFTKPSIAKRIGESSTPFTWRTCTATRTSPPVFCTIYAPAIKGWGFCK